MRPRLALTTGLAVVTLLALSGCFGGTGDSGAEEGAGEGSTGGEALSGGSTADCLLGDWDLDEDAMARALGERMTESGATVLSTSASGPVGLTVTADRMAWSSDVTYSVVIDAGEGLVMEIRQLQSGTSSGAWTLEDDWIVFSGWESDVVITSTTVVHGRESTTVGDLPARDSGASTVVTCHGDLLSTQPEGSPFVSVWTRR